LSLFSVLIYILFFIQIAYYFFCKIYNEFDGERERERESFLFIFLCIEI